MYSLEQSKRGLCPHDNKRYVLADFAHGIQNRTPTHTVTKTLPLNSECLLKLKIILEQSYLLVLWEKRFLHQHIRVVERVSFQVHRNSNIDLIYNNGLDKIPDCDREKELHGAELKEAGRAGDARPGWRGRLDKVIDLITRMNNI